MNTLGGKKISTVQYILIYVLVSKFNCALGAENDSIAFSEAWLVAHVYAFLDEQKKCPRFGDVLI